MKYVGKNPSLNRLIDPIITNPSSSPKFATANILSTVMLAGLKGTSRA